MFTRDWGQWPQLLSEIVWLLPGAVGVFVGAPLVAREVETGTFRFSWTQGTTRARQLSLTLATLGVLLTAATLALAALVAWWYAPWVPILGRMDGQAYEISGLLLTARAALALTLSVYLGALIGRVVAAIVASGLAWLAIVITTAVWIRPIRNPITAWADSSLRTSDGLNVDQWVTIPTGHRLAGSQLDRLDITEGPDLIRTGQSFDTWLANHGYIKWVSYQPDSRYWIFQSIESAGTLILAAALAVAAVVHIRRRSWN